MKYLIFNPFEKHSETVLIPFGIGAMALGALLGWYSHSNFDGVLDLHFSNYQLTFIQLLLENVINIAVLAISLFAFGKLINAKTRLIDLVAVALVSRVPIYAMSLFNVKGALSLGQSQDLHKVMDFAQANMTFLIILSVFMLFAIIWMFALMFNGFKISSNGKGTKLVLFFISSIIVAEAISKFIIYKVIL